MTISLSSASHHLLFGPLIQQTCIAPHSFELANMQPGKADIWHDFRVPGTESDLSTLKQTRHLPVWVPHTHSGGLSQLKGVHGKEEAGRRAQPLCCEQKEVSQRLEAPRTHPWDPLVHAL